MAGFRTIVINQRCKLESRLGYLVIRTISETRIHISEIESLIIETTSVSLTSALIADLEAEGINVVFCDRAHLPVGFIQPLNYHYNSSRRVKTQIAWTEERKNKCWQLIVKEKLKQQAFVLKLINQNEAAKQIFLYRENVLLGDSDNQEARAAKCYFSAMFGDSFSRSTSNNIENSALDYGYSILLACFSREISACGYLTELGIWHRSNENSYNLASDFMEPFRPIIDLHAYDMPLDQESNFKHYMLKILNKKILINEDQQELVYAIRQYSRRLFKFLKCECDDIYEILFFREE